MTQHLKLVSSFSDEKYPYKISLNPRARGMMFGQDYFDEYSRVPFDSEKVRVYRALKMTRIRDYRMFENAGNIELHLPTEAQMNDVLIALTFKNELATDIELDSAPISKRLLKKRMKHVAETLDKTSLRGRFYFVATPSENKLRIVTLDKPAYFEMRRVKPEEHILGIEFL